MTYEEYKESKKESKYFGLKCYIPGCDEPAEYELGDARFYCGGCEKHAKIKEEYKSFIDKYNKKQLTSYKNPNINYNNYIF